MKIFVDQSGKVEYTSRDTVVAFSNGKNASLIIGAAEKRKIQDSFRNAGKPDMFVFKTFSALVYLLIKDYIKSDLEIVIDREYWGRESVIKDFLLRIIRQQGHVDFNPANISFALVGKKHYCHNLAVSVIRERIKVDRVVYSKDILKLVL